MAGPYNNGFDDNPGGEPLKEKSACQNQVLERNIANRVRKEVDGVVTPVEMWVHDGFLTAMDIMGIPGVEIAVKSITGSSGRRSDSVVQNLDQKESSQRT